MYKFILACFVLCILHAHCANLIKVIEIMTRESLEDASTSDDAKSNFIHSLYQESFTSGESLGEADKEGFYSKLKEEDVQFYTSNNDISYSMSYAHLQGLVSDKDFATIEKEISVMKLKPINKDYGVSTLEVEDRDLSNTLRVIDQSLLLDSSLFKCSNRQAQIEASKSDIPQYVRKTCERAAQNLNLGLNPSIEDLMTYYRNIDIVKNMNIRDLEDCVEQLTLTMYFSSEILIKLSAGAILYEVAGILNSSDRKTKFYSYIVNKEAFLGTLTAIQKAIVSKARSLKPSLAHRLYSSSLQKFNRKVLLEVYEDSNPKEGHAKFPDVKVMIQGPSNQMLLEMYIRLDKFAYEISDFFIENYDDFEAICDSNVYPLIDVKKKLLPKESFIDKHSFKAQMAFLIVIVAVLFFTSLYNYVKSKNQTPVPRQRQNIEFKKLSKDEPDHDDSLKPRKKMSMGNMDDDSYDV